MRRPLCMVCLLFVMTVFLSVCMTCKEQGDLGEAEGKTVYLAGKVYHKEIRPSLSGEEQSVIYLNHIAVSGESESLFEKQKPIEGVVCYMTDNTQLPLGSIAVVKGTLQEFRRAANPGEFDSRQYYQILKLDFRLQNAEIIKVTKESNRFREGLYQIQEKCSHILEKYYDETDAGIMKTILLGDKNSLSEEVEEQYKRNGIIHVMAISGLHISMLGMGLYRLLKKCRFPTWLAGAVTVLLIWCYGIMTGMSASASRAIIMFMMKIGADIIGRTYDLLTALAVAAVLLLVEQPLYVKHCGFLLSFGAVMGIGIVLPMLEEQFSEKLPHILHGLLPGISVFLVSFPIQIYYYYQYPVYSIVLNLLIIPLMTFVMLSGFGVLAAGAVQLAFVSESIGTAAVFTGHSILRVYSFLCSAAEKLPGSVLITGKPKEWQIAVYYASLCIFLLWKMMAKEKAGKKKRIVAVGMQGVVLGMGFCILLMKMQSKPETVFLDVGQGDCIYIQSGNGKSYLIDGGSTNKSEVGKYQIIPFLKSRGIRTLEAVFVTHGDKDHYSGIEELLENTESDRIRIKRLFLPITEKEQEETKQGESKEGCSRLKQLAYQQKTEVFYIQSGDVLRDGKLTMECLNPAAEKKDGMETYADQETQGDKNEQSIVLYLTYEGFSALLTGDVTGKPEQEAGRIMKQKLGERKLTVLKVAHHGSMYSTSEEFLANVHPEISVISCGEKNRYGHPHEELLKRLEDAESRVMITKDYGAITVDWQTNKVYSFLERKIR